jgi:type IV pilus biogenesis protein CpaD/CtpE
MTYTHRTLIAAAAATLLSTTAVWAQSTAPAMGAAAEKPMAAKDVAAAFTKADISKDGKLDKAEADSIAGFATKFDAADADGDKMVSKAEFEKAMATKQ